MKVLIIEDEKAAVRNLKALLLDIDHNIEILAVTDSITESIEWLRNHPEPDLIFVDIHLADGSAFEIFEHIHIKSPVIFTTAYDEYALKAFKVNSVDYLLKPIDRNAIENALDKLYHLRAKTNVLPGDYSGLIRALKQNENYKTHFLIPVKGDKLFPLPVDSISYFYIYEGDVKAVTDDEKEYILNQTLDELNECLNPSQFFRVNRQYIISRKSVRDIDLWFNSRLSVNLKIPVKERILVSRLRVAEFKEWFTN
ncbi:LytTR family DNA-binding domain-containing protein [Parabacteroides sp. PF5-9]|uniref:LytR/AlgR family response regulator transcription factor n=1 Tax=Parabacteroides sp. PF5-9 TaxID=1742404 RepID=UPI0024760551|nr:LytTR family DNA-binding domain-containing protein [Parabacteroides sp. PF5-9]MDH6359082.1 DNA-binding LytR/AlgR family response regulator [Parabacteroides sp. PF5-9]